ncbi:M16 family metallopeptidase [Idiomarina xiamenensis]|uniref:M16 family peptidase n=1 Tax=Idiomarina xiamenensis 10-D-4 TaxID=740709 RepID=K2KYX3_9GAMM|nr:pitrilysin family protein [Idiomarina xiamenensis]EKE82930.1 M16 family peptidase [Idiomarina xiamenensis 10-D-4]
MRPMKTLTAVAIAAVLLGGCQATGQQTTGQASAVVNQQQLPVVDIDYQSFTLDNGLRVIVHEDHKAPIVAVNVWYAVGSKDEKPGKTGFAHLFEHLMFNGSKNYDDEYFGPFERAGATDMNGTTNNDRTNYFENVPTPALDMALWMESDRMGHMNAAITQAKLDEQRGVVQNEKRQGEAQPYGRAFTYIAEQTFPEGHPYSWTTIGSMDDLNAASLDDVHQWFTDYYGAANAVLVLAGDIDLATAKEKAQLYFGDIAPGKPLIKQDSWVAKRHETKRMTMQDNVPAARIYKVWNTAEMGKADATYLTLMADILGNGKNSRLYQRLVYNEQLASSVFAFQYDRLLAGQFILAADALPGVELTKIEKIIDEEVQRLMQEGPTAEELARVKFATAAGFVRGAERIGGFGGKSDILASGAVYHNDPGFYQQELAYINETSGNDIQNAMRTWLSDGDFILNVEPQPRYQASADGADRSQLPAVGELPTLALPALEQFTLSNGLQVALAERHDIPNVQMSLVFDSGYAADINNKAGAASFTMDMLTEGTEGRDALTLAAELERLGARISSNASIDRSTVKLDALTTNLAASLDVFADVIMRPAFSTDEIERKRALWLAHLSKEKADPRSQALRILPKLMFDANHPYSVPLTGSGTEQSISALQRDDLVAHQQTWLRPDNARLVVVGDTSVAELQPLLEQYLSDWQAPASAKPEKVFPAVTAPQQPRIYLIDQPGTPQSTIFAGQLAPNGEAPNAEQVDVMNTILGGSFTSRLNMNLREDKGWSYGARSIWFDAEAEGLWFAMAPVQTDKTAESMQEILRELSQYQQQQPATADELKKVQDNKTAKLPGAYETKSALLSALVDTLDKGHDVQWLEQYAQRVKAITLSEVKQTASSVLKPNALTWVIVGDRSQIEDDIKALGIADVQVVDSDGNLL